MVDMKNNSILYWKWDDSIFDGDLQAKIDDLCGRTKIQAVFIGLHWVKRAISDQELLETIRLCSREFHRRGRKIYLEVCPRNEGAAFFEKHPDQVAFLTAATEIPLDWSGKGSTKINLIRIPHFWRTNRKAQERILAAYTLVKSGDTGFIGSSVRNAEEYVCLKAEQESEQEERLLEISVDAGESCKGQTAVVFAGIPQPIPDLASDDLPEFFADMLDRFSEGEIDGVCSDEWGYDVWLRTNEEKDGEPSTFYEKRCCLDHISYSDNFAKIYGEVGGGQLKRDLLNFFYIEDGDTAKSIAGVNSYHKAFRRIMRKNDEDMYQITKSKLGADTFFGVHPTWWGSNYLQNFEGFKNGFYWWEAKRDIAQTDEIVILPIRTALAHKWKSSVWYNMWYSMGTRRIDTYYKETWNNVRFGGRTHYLGYECPNESAVLELKQEGLLENIEKMDAVVRTIDPYQTAQPDCRVLILFGMENALNWFYNDDPTPPWFPRHQILTRVLECADKVFGSFLCDLIPTAEIANGSLYMDGDRPRYGNQAYDAVVLLAPDSMDRACFTLLSGIDKERFIVAGRYATYDDGSEISPEDRQILQAGTVFEDVDCAADIIRILEEWNIRRNRFENGCVLQDGSLIFTCSGEKAVNNKFTVDAIYEKVHISFEGEDMLYLHHRDAGYIPIYPNGKLDMRREEQPVKQKEQTKC